MTDDTRKLIERAGEWLDAPDDGSSMAASVLIEEMKAVLEAVLPTEDDREALVALKLARFTQVTPSGVVEKKRSNEEAADLVIAAGFRRSPVPPELPDPNSPGVHWECDCVPDLGPTHCHGCGEAAGRIVAWSETVHGLAAVPPVTEETVIDKLVRRMAEAQATEDEIGIARALLAGEPYYERVHSDGSRTRYELRSPVTEEPEWEYGLVNPWGGNTEPHLVSGNREHIETQHRRGHPAIQIVRRRAAGSWEPVPEGDGR